MLRSSNLTHRFEENLNRLRQSFGIQVMHIIGSFVFHNFIDTRAYTVVFCSCFQVLDILDFFNYMIFEKAFSINN